ncbi:MULTISPECIES: ArgS-related anticodon-binding protein NrtL [unclassified Streptomyces]|uniref:ArgS-related anticodon-binding protein NrtL n=1 Tax=unclassified Streptomyces TaxID=2593676 RepID=UPI003076B122
MTPVELSRTVLHAVRRAVDAGELNVTVPARAVVAPPGPGGCGDYATSIALQLARPAGQPSRRVAEVLRPYLVAADGITDVVLTGPGFLNISLHGTAPADLVAEILRHGPRYGHGHGHGRADGTGPESGRIVQLHCPHDLRAVVVAEAAARILRSQGALVRTSCTAPPEPEWTATLGVRVDAAGPAPAALPVDVRPVPAPADPLPLGRDAGRWALLHPAAHDRPRIGDEHLVQRESNPLFRVRYAHARTRALSRNAADLGFAAEPGPVSGMAQDGMAQDGTAHDGTAQELLVALADHPRVLAAAAEHRAPDRLARHLVTVADAALPFLPTVLPRGGEKPSAAHRARLALAEAVGAVLAGGLSLLGIDAPDHL